MMKGGDTFDPTGVGHVSITRRSGTGGGDDGSGDN